MNPGRYPVGRQSTDRFLAVEEELEGIDAVCHSTTYHGKPVKYYRRLIGILKEDLLQDCRENNNDHEAGNCGNDIQNRKPHLDRKYY